MELGRSHFKVPRMCAGDEFDCPIAVHYQVELSAKVRLNFFARQLCFLCFLVEYLCVGPTDTTLIPDKNILFIMLLCRQWGG